MKTANWASLFAATLLVGGCATTAPSSTTATYFAIYDLPASAHLAQVEDAVVGSANEVTGSSNVSDLPPPSPLPAQPGRFQILNAGSANTSMGFTDPGQAGQLTYMMTNAHCPGSSFSVTGQEVSNPAIQIKTVYCIYPYARGTQVDVVLITSQNSGTSGGATGYLLHMTRSLFNSAGEGWEQRINQEFSDLQLRLAKIDARVTVADSYLPSPSVESKSN